jgi:hypothetical protein
MNVRLIDLTAGGERIDPKEGRLLLFTRLPGA